MASTDISGHVFTTPFGGDGTVSTCGCGAVIKGETSADMFARCASHLEAMRDDARAARFDAEEKAGDATDPATTCANGDGEITYDASYQGIGRHVHVATGSPVCATETFRLASPVPHCPKCKGVDVWAVEDTNWGIASNCGGCGYHTYYSLGD